MKVCPYLGLLQDSKTPAIFPSERNCCYRAQPPRLVLETHQQAHCLGESHQACPVFLDPEDSSGRDFFYTQDMSRQGKSFIPYALAFLILLVLALAAWLYRDTLFGVQAAAQPPAPAMIATPLQAASQEPTMAPADSGPLATLLVTPTVTPRPTDTPPAPAETASTTPPPGLGSPIGTNPPLVIHRVSSGESLTTISRLYGTTETAIRAVNLLLPIPVWENWLIVVPYQTEDVANLPLFEVYQVNTDGQMVSSLAKQLNVDASLMAQYNNLDENDFFANGQWVLVPHTRR
jgi:LysM repeat protein